ncbi:MAG: DUF924 family protein [Cyanobacteria bacterium J06635_1]
MPRASTILDFWFGPPDDEIYGQFRKAWFRKDPTFDAQIRTQFLTDYEAAAAGRYDGWRGQPRHCLALILLLDQFSRNLFRGQPQSFATDPQALEIAQFAIATGYESALIPVERFFLYLPLEHSENQDHQTHCVDRFKALVKEDPSLKHGLDYALRHQAVIEQFGRFPHRNQTLKRLNTPAEIEFLKQPGSRF